MIWFIEILKIQLEEQLLIKHVAKDPRYNGYQRGLAAMVYKCIGKKRLVAVLKIRTFQTKIS